MGHFVTLATCLQISHPSHPGLRLRLGKESTDKALTTFFTLFILSILLAGEHKIYILYYTCRGAYNTLTLLQESTPVSGWSSCSPGSSPSSWWRSTCPAPWRCPCPGCRSGWTTRRWVAPGLSHLSSCFVLFTVVILVLSRGVTTLPSSLSANQRPVLGHVITVDQIEASVPSSTTDMPPATCSLSEY